MKVVYKIRFILFLSFISFIIICFIGGYFFVKHQIITPFTNEDAEQAFIIEIGEGLNQVALHLEEAGLIRNRIWFISYVVYKGWAAQLQAGEYSLNPSFNIPQIARKIAGGEAFFQDVEITIPEGFDLKKIDARLSKAGLIESGELLKQFELEGYLFPDTYRFSKDDGIDRIIVKMRENFDRKIDNNLLGKIEQQGKTIEEIIIMASLLEKEVRSDEDREIVSGIFWKRLGNNYPLQSCATIAYVLGEDKLRYSTEDTKVDSPYNTYQNIGFPPGPICNPGLSAIQAAIEPQDNDYNFFLSKPDGETVFSKTLEEHNLNKAKYLN